MATENRKARKFIDIDLKFRADDQNKDITESVISLVWSSALKFKSKSINFLAFLFSVAMLYLF